MNQGMFAGIPRVQRADTPRRKIFTLTESNAVLAIPQWARGGKGVVYVTGVAGGGGGRRIANATGGSSGASARQHPVPIPAGVSQMSCVVGAAGDGAIADDTFGTSGGATSVGFVGVVVLPLSLAGGVSGQTNALASLYGRSVAGVTTTDATTINHLIIGVILGPSLTVFSGNKGVGSIAEQITYTTGYNGIRFGASSPFGGGGEANSSTMGPATGYGAGGGGALNTQIASKGSPGLLILEFVEGF